MTTLPPPPEAYVQFIERFPELGRAWDLIHRAGGEGPLGPEVQRLIKLAVAVGALREGAVHSGVRKAKAMGIPREAIDQVVALAAGTLGMPAAVAAHSWVADVFDA